MGMYITYDLKIEPRYHNVYRIIRIDGNNTLHDLCSEILSAFNFDNDHLYMFSLKRKKYDGEGYFHPEASGEKSADEVSLNELNLKVRNKFLLLYDFGDEWLFDITVKKIEQSDILTLTHIKEQSGEIFQYPAWDDEENEYEEGEAEYEEFSKESEAENRFIFMDTDSSMVELLSENKPSDLKAIMRTLGIKFSKASKSASKGYANKIANFLSSNKEKLLDLLTPSAVILLYSIAFSDDDTAFEKQMETLSLDILIDLGLVEISNEYESFTIDVTRELYEFADYFKDSGKIDKIKQNYEWQKIFIALINLYGVAELKFLHESLCRYLKTQIDLETFKKSVVKPMAFWSEINFIETEVNSIVTIYAEEITENILTDRNNYDVLDYKKYDDEKLSGVISKGITHVLPDFKDITEYILVEKQISPKEAVIFFVEFSATCLMGKDSDSILEMCEEWLGEHSLKLTKKLKDIILRIIKKHPCTLLMGFSWDEYNNKDTISQNQISLFDDFSF